MFNFQETKWVINWVEDFFRVSCHEVEMCVPMSKKELSAFKKFLKQSISSDCNTYCGKILCDAMHLISTTEVQYQLRKDDHRLTFILKWDQIPFLIKSLN